MGKGSHQQTGLSTGTVSNDNELAAELGHGGGSREMKGVGKVDGLELRRRRRSGEDGRTKQSRRLTGREKTAVDGDERWKLIDGGGGRRRSGGGEVVVVVMEQVRMGVGRYTLGRAEASKQELPAQGRESLTWRSGFSGSLRKRRAGSDLGSIRFVRHAQVPTIEIARAQSAQPQRSRTATARGRFSGKGNLQSVRGLVFTLAEIICSSSRCLVVHDLPRESPCVRVTRN
jgi:hypothetical protein